MNKWEATNIKNEFKQTNKHCR